MNDPNPRLAGVELYFQDLEAAKHFYLETLGLHLGEEQREHHVRFDVGPAFICLERKGVEDYPSADKAVVFIEVADLAATLGRIGTEQVLRRELVGSHPWAAVRDPEGHTVLLRQS